MEPHSTLLFITLGSTQQEYLKSQIVLRPSSWKACEVGKLMVLGKAMVSPHCWQWQKAVHDHHVALVVMCVLNQKWLHGETLGQGTKSYANCNKLSGVISVHIHNKWWVWDPIDATSTKIGLPNQTLTWCHATKTYNHESFNGETFSTK
jgi:hypothetical protein